MEFITMAANQFKSFFYVLILFCVCLQFITNAHHEERKVYIVYMGVVPQKEVEPSAYYATILQELGVSEEYLIRVYTKSFGGFAANITEMQQQALADHDEVVSVFPNRKLKLHTTESWDFLGFPLNVTRSPTTESDIIIGILDTGIWPTSDSFNDNGFSSPPKKWNGTCSGGKNFTCNNKIIGARFYVDDSVLDKVGHGSHVASIAAGNTVNNASFFGIAQGTARGAVPSARIAVYKVCTAIGCDAYDILKAFDDALHDGVDILSISFAEIYPSLFEDSPTAIGSFHALARGILTVQAAGDLYDRSSISSEAPWLFTVGASTTSRMIMNKVGLGNGTGEYGYAINSFDLHGEKFPLVYGKEAQDPSCSAFSPELLSSCTCLDKNKVKGKIVICDKFEDLYQIVELGDVGLAGVILSMDNDTFDNSVILPTAGSILRPHEFELLASYQNSTKNPKATIFISELFVNKSAPTIASFSARGPNTIVPDILKPDITAPGVNILAAFTPLKPASGFFGIDPRVTPFNFRSGTSIACPHVVGAAAYVKSHHLDWSPSAIKSALMTTSKQMDASESGDGNMEFSFGSGFLDPTKALNPGLVYETTKMDYVEMLCNIGYDNKSLRLITGDDSMCQNKDASAPKDLNYPTIASKLD